MKCYSSPRTNHPFSNHVTLLCITCSMVMSWRTIYVPLLSLPEQPSKFRLCTHNRNEEGIYYAIDLGGTNFRALKVEVGAGSVVTSRKVELPIPEELTKGTIEVLVISYNFQFLT